MLVFGGGFVNERCLLMVWRTLYVYIYIYMCFYPHIYIFITVKHVTGNRPINVVVVEPRKNGYP